MKTYLFGVDASVEAGAVLDNDEGPAEHHHLHAGRPGKPHLHPPHRYLHLRRARHATVRQGLYRRELCPRPHSKVRKWYK